MTKNYTGLPCKAKTYCPIGSAVERDCLAGYYCPETSSSLTICPAGYYCPNSTSVPFKCEYPYYCPTGSSSMLLCPLGYKALTNAGNRTSTSDSCLICPGGFYGNHPLRHNCSVCFQGYYCPAGTTDPYKYPCPIGHYCTVGVALPIPCSPGMYGTKEKATKSADCLPCPVSTYNDQSGQSYCRQCGSSANATIGSAKCTCIGKNRAFQVSDGACVCKYGYVYYDEQDRKQTEGNSNNDCQEMVGDRCPTGTVRDSSTRTCVNPTSFATTQCVGMCGPLGGTYNPNFGSCECKQVTTFSEQCNATCQTTMPSVEIKRLSNGQLQLTFYSSNRTSAVIENIFNELGLPSYDRTSRKCQLIDMKSDGMYGFQPKDLSQANLFSTTTSRRKRRAVASDPVQIRSPVICISIGQAIVFRVNLNTQNRSLSNYPQYKKNHLFNTNPDFDYGNFRQLHTIIQTTNQTITMFVHLFTEPGIHVFYDNANSARETIVVVPKAGSACQGKNAIEAPLVTQLTLNGVNKGTIQNLAPDWNLIYALIATMLVFAIFAVVVAIIWKPRAIGIYTIRAVQPKYRSLGAPIPVVPIPGIDDNPSLLLGPRGAPEGAADFDSFVPTIGTGKGLLENFSVRTLYDKLEDQSLHMTSQLARHQSDLRGFYDRICQQTEGLKQMLASLDVSLLAKATENAAKIKANAGIEREDLQQASVNEQVKQKVLIAGESSREKDLMQSVQQLLEKYEGGWQPVVVQDSTQLISGQSTVGKMYSAQIHQASSSVSSATVLQSGAQQVTLQLPSGDFGDDLKRMNAERVKLDEELRDTENKEIKIFVDQFEAKRRAMMKEAGEELAEQLTGDLSESEMKRIIDAHNVKVKEMEERYDNEKDRQQAELMEKLAQRRLKREMALRNEHSKIALKHDLNLDDIGTASDPETTLRRLQNSINLVSLEESLEIARAEAARASLEMQEQNRTIGSNFSDAVEHLAEQGTLSTEDAEEVKRRSLEVEEQLERGYEMKINFETDQIRRNLANRKEEKMAKLLDRQAAEKAEAVRESGDLHELSQKHEKERELLETSFEVEEQEHLAEIKKRIREEQRDALIETHRQQIAELSSQKGLDKAALEQLIDKLRKQNNNLAVSMEQKRGKSLEDTMAKLAARKARKEQEVNRRAKEEAQQKILEEQSRLAASNKPKDMDEIVLPDIIVAKDSVEITALKKEQDRTIEELKEHQEQVLLKLTDKLEKETRDEESRKLKAFEAYRLRAINEVRNRQAAELSSRNDLDASESQRLLDSHQRELDDLVEKLDAERNKQQNNLKQKLEERKRQKEEALKRKQEAEVAKELLEQKKELAETHLAAVKKAEKDAILDAIREHGSEFSEFVIRKILDKRHSEEMLNLDETFAEERKVGIDAALSKLEEEHNQQIDELRAKHEKELRALEDEGLSTEELQQRRGQLFNQQSLEQSSLERKHAEEKKSMQRGALSDWELRYARAKLELKERHYKEFAECLNELSPDQAAEHQRAIEQANEKARQLAEIKNNLEDQRKENEEKIKHELEEFQAEEEKRLELELQEFNKELEREMEDERQKNEKAILALNQRKEALLREKKLKAKQEVERLSQQGGSKEQQEILLNEHAKDLAKLMNKMDADRMRMQSSLEERLRKKREERMKSKVKELETESEESRKELTDKLESESEKIKTDETLILKETINVDTLVEAAASTGNAPPSGKQTDQMPAAYRMAAPLTDGELTSLLMSSPLYQKLQEIQDIVGGGEGSLKAKKSDEPFIDIKDDTLFSSDDDLVPVDLDVISAREFIVYKFSCFIADLLVVQCYHKPISILLAEKLPPNAQLTRNAYRNSFFFDANNKILYMRRDRLESVGDFILVLVHTLAHIKVENMIDDSDPAFVKEFYRSISVVCNDLFFARYKRSSALSSAMMSFPEETAQLEDAGKFVLESVFGDAHNEIDRQNVIDELLDTNLLRSSKNLVFNQEVMFDRVTKYTDFVISNRLRSFLGDIEDKVKTARLQGTETEIDKRLQELTGKTDEARPKSRYLPTRGNMATRDATRQASRNMALARSSTSLSLLPTRPITRAKGEIKEDLYQSFIETQIEEIGQKMDDLNQEFVAMTRQSVELTEEMRSIESDIASQTEAARSADEKSPVYSQKSQLLKDSYSKLNSVRAQLAQLTIAKSDRNKRLQLYKKELEDKQHQLDFHNAKPIEEREKQSRRKLESAMGNKLKSSRK